MAAKNPLGPLDAQLAKALRAVDMAATIAEAWSATGQRIRSGSAASTNPSAACGRFGHRFSTRASSFHPCDGYGRRRSDTVFTDKGMTAFNYAQDNEKLKGTDTLKQLEAALK